MDVLKDGPAKRNRLRAGRRWRTRLGAITSMAIVISGLLTPSAAYAGNKVPCPADITEWIDLGMIGRTAYHMYEGHRFTTQSVTPQFFVSDGRLLDNNTDQPVNYTISSSVSKTYKVSASVGVTANVMSYLSSTVSANVESSRTTDIGVSLTTTVPPHTRLIAEYGVEGYNVSYGIEAWHGAHFWNAPPAPGDRCEEWGWYPQITIAPTHIEGWRLRTA